jgi:cell shape-determining protein MreC
MQDALERFGLVLKTYAFWLVMSGLIFGLSFGKLFKPIVVVIEHGSGSLIALTSQVWSWGQFPLVSIRYWHDGSVRLAEAEARLQRMAVDKSRLSALETENETLKALTRLKLKPSANVQTVGHWTGSNERGVIYPGDQAGIQNEMVVTDTAGIYVGTVVKTSAYLALVQRPFDRQSKLAVRVLGKTTNGVLTGDGQAAHLEGVLQQDSLTVGDLLVTSSAEGRIPEGIAVGEVSRLNGEVADVTKGAEVKLLGNYQEGVIILPGTQKGL